jgi:hypothetical protein
MKKILCSLGDSLYEARLIEKPNSTTLVLSASKFDSKWTEKAHSKPFVELNDNGNGIAVALGNKLFYLDYSQVEELRIALNVINTDTKGSTKEKLKKWELK